MDFHPNTTGNQLIADMLLEKIKLEISKDNQIDKLISELEDLIESYKQVKNTENKTK